MKLRTVTRAHAASIRSCDSKLRHIVADLRAAGASKAADAVARARKSVGGAIRHADRVIDAELAEATRNTPL